MKNIHVLPTEKPSRLFKFANQLHLDTIPKDYYKKYNIYITSDEDIKDEDYCVHTNQNSIIKICEGEGKLMKGHLYLKKIILTTDQDLIADGVQAIDNEFLEWFVKNPSCERVEVRELEHELISHINPKIRFSALQELPSFIPTESLNNMILTYKYKITIPQEEPNPFELPKALPDDVFYQSLEAKQETLEDGAKYQADNMYSLDEIKNALKNGYGIKYFSEQKFLENLEQFKKKQ